MSRRSPCLSRHIGLLPVTYALLFLSSPSPSQSQSGTSPETVTPTIRSTVRMVLVDVVVTNGKDEPVKGLTKDQFQILEDGKPQTMASFEEHAGMPDVPELSRMAKLPPNVFSNAPLARAGEAANILLLDSLNTQMADQSDVRARMLKYLKEVRPGTRMAIFTLSDRLRFVQGFTADPALLIAAMNGKNSAGNPQLSSLLETPVQAQASQTLSTQMHTIATEAAEAGGSSQGGVSQFSGAAREAAQGASDISGAADALSHFLTENTNSQTVVRANLTLEAIDQLAMYLQAIPGRKNVIWFTGSFPLNTLAMSSSIPMRDRDFGPEVARTANLLAAARIAIYPLGVGAVGLAPNAMYDNATPPPIGGIASQQATQVMTQSQTQALDQESTERVQSSASLDEMATNTGGKAFINTNGFNDVLDQVVKTGTYYYTLTYSPTNRSTDGQLRHIQIKLTGGKYHLAYRRGYYATNDFLSSASKTLPKGDPLKPLMERGTPDSTAILYTMKVASATNQPGTLEPAPASGSKRAGDNEKLVGAVTRYSVTFAIPPEHLALEASPDGVHHGSLEVTLLAYDRVGTPVNWLVRLVQVRVPPDRFAQAQANGVGFRLDMDVPTSAVYLRSGLYDTESNKAGTMEIPLAAVLPLATERASTTATHDDAVLPPLPAPLPPANVAASPGSVASVPSVAPGPNSAATLALETAQELEVSDVPKYCSDLAMSQEHSSSLASVCEFVLNVRKTLSNIICDRQTKRYWSAPARTLAGAQNGAEDYHRSDVVTVNVTYRDGRELYSDVRLDGKPITGKASELSGSWSHGEFATLLTSIFAPSSKTQFHYSKQTKLRSIPVFVFDFNVAAENNRLYFLESGDKIWFPEYKGEIWIDARTSSLLRMELETAYMADYPIRLAKDEIEYSSLHLGDGSSMVLPTNSKELICGQRDSCSNSVTKFANWHKFGATTRILVKTAN